MKLLVYEEYARLKHEQVMLRERWAVRVLNRVHFECQDRLLIYLTREDFMQVP